ncbi:MAG: PrgI family protein [Bullifex sp.]
MEVKINKEIREYSENMFFGLTLRQFFFSALGCAAAVGIYFLCRDALGLEITTWLCVLGVIPFAVTGFLRYNGMPAEKFIAAYVKSRFIFPSKYLSKPKPLYYEMMEENIALRQGSLSKRELRKIKRRQEKVEKKAGEEKKESKKRKRGRR